MKNDMILSEDVLKTSRNSMEKASRILEIPENKTLKKPLKSCKDGLALVEEAIFPHYGPQWSATDPSFRTLFLISLRWRSARRSSRRLCSASGTRRRSCSRGGSKGPIARFQALIL